jgi:hypothetical protein
MSDSAFQTKVDALAGYFQHGASVANSSSQARMMAQGNLYRQLITQSTMMAYLDVITVLAIGCVCMIPLVFLMKKRQTAGPVAMH